MNLGTLKSYLEKTKNVAYSIYSVGIPFFIGGGDHLFTFPIVEGIYNQRKTPFTIVQLDYHLDVQIWGEFDNHFPNKLTTPTHANFVSWIKKVMPDIQVMQLGIDNYQNVVNKECLPNILSYLQSIGTQISNLEILYSNNEELFKRIPKNQDVYLTIDVDVLNFLYIPNTGYPASLGIDLQQFFSIIAYVCKNNNIIGVDIMEFGKTHLYESQMHMLDIVINTILLILKNI